MADNKASGSPSDRGYPAHQDEVYDRQPGNGHLGNPDFVPGTSKKQTEGHTN